MSLVELANETLLTIVGYLTRESDINAFTQTNRQLYFATNSYLYQFAISRGNNAGLRIASTLGNYSLVHMLLEMGANPRSTPRESTHVTALHFAAAEGHLQIVDALIQAGANVNAVTSNGISPLHEAVLGGFVGVIRLLLDNGADPLIRFPKANRATVLHLASHWGYSDVVRVLLQKGLSTEVQDCFMRTPLHYALDYNSDEISWTGSVMTVELLLQYKANKEAWDKFGRRPKDFARHHPSTVVKILLEKGSDCRIEEAIKLEKQILERKKLEEAKVQKRIEVTAECTARRIERLRECEELRKIKSFGRLLKSEEDESNREQEEIIAEINRELKQDMNRQRWGDMRMRADGDRWLKEIEEHRRRQASKRKHMASASLRMAKSVPFITNEKQESTCKAWAQIRKDSEQKSWKGKEKVVEIRSVIPVSKTPARAPPIWINKKQEARQEAWSRLRANIETSLSTLNPKRSYCAHPISGWLKCKGKGQCEICGNACTKVFFRCGDCGIGTCAKCRDMSLHR